MKLKCFIVSFGETYCNIFAPNLSLKWQENRQATYLLCPYFNFSQIKDIDK